MTLSWAGFDNASGFGIETEGQWATLNHRAGKLNNSEGILTGGGLTAVVGARRLNVAAFTGLLPGLLVDNDGVMQTPLHDAQASGTRLDLVTLTANWSTNQVYFEVLKGTGTTLPTLGAQQVGALYRIPYARVTVRAGAAQFDLAADVEACKPGPRFPTWHTGPVNPQDIRGSAQNWNSIGNLDISDPGWPYRMQVSASARFDRTVSDGHMRVRAYDIDQNSVIGDGVSATLSSGRAPAIVLGRLTNARTGSRRIRLEAFPTDGIDQTEVIRLLADESNFFSVQVFPAA